MFAKETLMLFMIALGVIRLPFLPITCDTKDFVKRNGNKTIEEIIENGEGEGGE